MFNSIMGLISSGFSSFFAGDDPSDTAASSSEVVGRVCIDKVEPSF